MQKELVKKVVVIDDNPLMFHLIKGWLNPNCIDVQYLNSLDKIIPMLNGFKPDLIISDILIPGISSTELIALFKQIAYPKVLVSSMDIQDIEFFARQIDAINYFNKPINPKLLFQFLQDFFASNNK